MRRFHLLPFLFLLCPPPCPLPGQSVLARGEPRLFRGERLEAIGLPLGGVGTGNIWIDGRGQLAVWQICNNLTERAWLPWSGFSLRVSGPGLGPRVRRLGGEDDASLKVESFRGQYPFGRFRYARGGLPVQVTLEAFNPLIPLDLPDSSLPCAIFRFTVKNEGDREVKVTLAATGLNGVGWDGESEVDFTLCGNDGFGGNLNEVIRGEGWRGCRMSVAPVPPPGFEGPLTLYHWGRSNRALETCANLTVKSLPRTGEVPAGAVVWLEGLEAGADPRALAAMANLAGKGGHLLLTGTRPSFFDQINGIKEKGLGRVRFFADFEGADYGGWQVEGEAFGRGPARGTLPRQQRVSGFMGKGLVNTFRGGDGATGTLTSPPFTIDHRWIGFLVGGGAHKGMTCIELLLEGKVVQSAGGRNRERLRPVQWDVSAWRGKEARLRIADRHTCAWGHINVDRILFSDRPPLALLGRVEALKRIAGDFPRVTCSQVMAHGGLYDDWKFQGGRPLPLPGPKGAGGASVAVLDGQSGRAYRLGRGKLVISTHPSSIRSLAALAAGMALPFRATAGLPRESSRFGTMALAALHPRAGVRTDCFPPGTIRPVRMPRGEAFTGSARSGPSPPGRTLVAGVSVPLALAPGESGTATFLHAWSFPNLERYGHEGNLYAERFPDAADVVDYVFTNFDRLQGETKRYRDTLYETNLPYRVLECISSQSCIPRTVLCFHAARHKGTGLPYFAGWEGCYACCPLNCTHVWNYAQTHARLWPSLGRNLRRYDFNHYLKPSGEHQHRQHRPTRGFIDGQCAILCGALREHQLSRDDTFLRGIWPGVKRALEWLIRTIDPDEDGVNGGLQWNTYDVRTGGAHTFIGSQYLAALAAGARMAEVMGDGAAAARWGRLRVLGSRNQDRLLWNGEYWIQKPDRRPARDYNTGCHSDQLLGQWWAHMLDLGRLYPQERVRTALGSIHRYNFRRDLTGFRQRPRRYVVDGDGGLLMCTWPHGGRPDPFILYADEVWTGIEYATAGLMLYEGLLEPACTLVRTARDRYDGRLREGLNSGPGGNPFCELECGRFYARALSSWSLLLAAQGFLHDGPARVLGFLPRWRPDDHRSLFLTARGWGLFRQERREGRTRAAIEVRWGKVELARLILDRPREKGELGPLRGVTLGGRAITPAAVGSAGKRRWLTFDPPLTVPAGRSLVVAW